MAFLGTSCPEWMPLSHRPLIVGLLVLLAVLVIPQGGLAVAPQVTAVALGFAGPAEPNTDGLYAVFLITANVTITSPGVVDVLAGLDGCKRGESVWNETWASLTAGGTSSVRVALPGGLIRLRNVLGPCRISVEAQGIDVSEAGIFGGPLVSIEGTTLAFGPSTFVQPRADFSGAPSGFVLDRTGDGLYDAFLVRVPLQVLTPGPVSLEGAIGYGWEIPSTLVAGGSGSRSLEVGSYIWELRFLGSDLYVLRLNGSVVVQLTLTEPSPIGGALDVLNQTTYRSPNYTFTEFTPNSVTVNVPITAAPIDPDGNGRAETLLLRVPLVIRAAGSYSVSAQQRRPRFAPPAPGTVPLPGLRVVRSGFLTPGSTTVDLPISGIYLNRLPPDSDVTFRVTVTRLDSDSLDQDALWFSYVDTNPDAFEAKPLRTLNVTAWYPSGGCSVLSGEAADLSTGFTYQGSSSADPGMERRLTLELYPGTFEVELSGCVGTQSKVLTVTITENESLNVALSTEQVNETYRLRFPAWNESVLEATSAPTFPSSADLRFYADLAGDRNGFANESEIALSVYHLCRFSLLPVHLAVDGLAVAFGATTLVRFQGEGPVVSASPIMTTCRYDLGLPDSSRPASDHQIDISLAPVVGDPILQSPYNVTVELPADANASASVYAVIADWIGLPAPARITVRQTSPNEFLLIPDHPPTGQSYQWRVHVLLAVRFPSQGSPSEPFGFVAFFAVAAVTVAACLGTAFLMLRRSRRSLP